MQQVNFNYFDANCMLGRHVKLNEHGLHTADDLLNEMDHYGIAEAMVIDCLSREHHPADGNQRILELTDNQPRLHRAWAALQPGTDEQPDPSDLLEQMKQQQVAAVYLFTGQYRISLADWCVDALLEPLAAAKVPVILCPNHGGTGGMMQDMTDWNAVVELCRRWPTLPVMVSEFRFRQSQRTIYRALDACDNLYLETSGYWLHHGIEYITRRWGSERLIFGSNWPLLGQHMTLATLACAEIDDNDKRQIAGDNFRRLIRWNQPPHSTVEPTPPADEFVQFGRTGNRPDNMVFHDCHGHLGGRMAHYHVPDGDLDSTVKEMDRLGVEQICVFSFSGITSDEKFGNDVVIDAVQRYPDRFVGFTLLNPHRGKQAMLRELERCAKQGLRGIKLIPQYQQYPGDGELIDVPCQWADERQQIILNHDWGSYAHMERLGKDYPQACFINGHTKLEYAKIVRQCDHLYICSCPLLHPRTCEEVVEAIGADRLLFGSDLQDLPIAWGLGPILFSRLPVEDKKKILGGNLQNILKQYSLSP